jgi:hypothetical protein
MEQALCSCGRIKAKQIKSESRPRALPVSRRENESRIRGKTQSLAVALGDKTDPGAESKLAQGLDTGNQKQDGKSRSGDSFCGQQFLRWQNKRPDIKNQIVAAKISVAKIDLLASKAHGG